MAFDPSNPDAPEGTPNPPPKFAEQSDFPSGDGASGGEMPAMQHETPSDGASKSDDDMKNMPGMQHDKPGADVKSSKHDNDMKNMPGMQQEKPSHPVGADKTSAKKTYSCSMHPEVVSDKPGRCPKCGMTLQLRQSSDGGAP